MNSTTQVFLMDNGSLEPAAVLSLRLMASALTEQVGQKVQPLSLLHSSSILSQDIDSLPAEIFEPALLQRLQNGHNDFLIVPAFFGPSAALTDYLPRRVAALKTKYPQLCLRVAAPLVDAKAPADSRIASILEERVRQVIEEFSRRLSPTVSPLPGPAVIVVDHGSPVRAVAEVRDLIAHQLATRLDEVVIRTVAASMERRPGPDYSFNEPLLENAFDSPGLNSGLVVVALLFLSPGRHAGPSGDIAEICAKARERHPNLHPVMTAPIGPHPRLIEILAERLVAGFASQPL